MTNVVFERKAMKIGGSLAVAIPTPIIDTLEIRRNTRFKIWVGRGNRIIIQKEEDYELQKRKKNRIHGS